MALHKMVAAGHEPAGLLVMVNRELQRSWFHGADLPLLREIARSLDIPLLLCESGGGDYHTAMEAALKQAKAQGVGACVFGDIDIEDHRTWCRERCDAAGLQCIHPLWQRNRTENTAEILALGYRCIIKCVRNADLPPSFWAGYWMPAWWRKCSGAASTSAARTANITPSCWTARSFIPGSLRLP